MKKRFYLLAIIFFTLFFNRYIFSQDSLKIEINNRNIKFKSLTYQQIETNKLRLSIKDSYGDEITGLKKNDFIISRKMERADILKVIPLSQSVDQKQRLVLIIDNSTSMAPFTKELGSIIDNLITNLSSGFYVSIISFDESLDNNSNKSDLKIGKLPFTRNIHEIREYCNYALETLSQRTYLNDAIKTSISAIREDTIQHVFKNFVVVLSDGYDLGSKSDQEDIQNMDKNKITFYSVDFMHSTRGSSRKNTFLKTLAHESDGEYFSPKDIDALRANFRRITSGIINLGYEIDYEFKNTKPSVVFEMNTNEFNQRPEPYRTFQGLLLEDMKMNESFPLLNYVFFDKNISSLPERYIHFSDTTKTISFSENKIEGDAIKRYYHILNIYGKRLRNYPEAAITLIGNTDGTETNWEELSRDRAKYIKKYFTEVWKIDPSRIQVLSGKLPGKPSSQFIEDGKAENRRVEFYSTNWEIMRPVTFIQDTINITPKLLNYRLTSPDQSSIKKMILDILNNNMLWNSFQFDKKFGTKLNYDWRSKDDLLPKNISKLDFKVTAYDRNGDSLVSNLISIPVKEITPDLIKKENLPEKMLQKVSLILFDYDSFNPGENNETIMKEYVYKILSDTTQYISVDGYTDKIGNPNYNLKLSEKRAEKIRNLLMTKYAPKKIKYKGIGSAHPIYSNNLPEGRFYNRTVQLIFQNYNPE